MKNVKSLTALAILLIAFATCTEMDPALGILEEEEEGIPEATPVGTPVDDMVTKEIGPDGGAISAIDNNLKLVIPVGALNTTTIITVQPITNFAPGGVGDAYELSPDGQSFSKPVTLTFNYMDSVQGGATWSEIGIAFQDANGFWHRAQNIVSDSINKTISATSSHFTAFSIYRRVTIAPIHSIVHVKKSVQLYLTLVEAKDDDELMFLSVPKGLSTTWMVEGIKNGDATVGKISTQGNKGVLATYTAPDKVPSKNLLDIKVHIKGRKFDISRFAFIKVVDEWHFTLEMGEGHGVVSKNYSYDKVLLDIDVVKNVVTISNIINFAPKPPSVTETILQCTHTSSGGSVGQIHIVSATGTVGTGDHLLTLKFTHSGAQFPTLTTKCPDADPVTTGGESFSGSPVLEHFQLTDDVQIHGIENDLYWAKLTPR